MKITFTQRIWFCFVALKLVALLNLEAAKAQVVLTQSMDKYSQDFNALPVSVSSTWENGSFYFPGWTIQRTSTTTSLLVGTGSSNLGGLYSYGASGSSDRALGAISSGSATAGQFAWGLLIQNKTGAPIKALHINFTGEQWRSASKTAGSQATTFWHSQSAETADFNLSPLSDKNWMHVPELDFYSIVNFSPAGALDGNLPSNKNYLSSSIVVDIPDGHYFMLRWKDLNDLDDDHGLAIDDFSLTWSNSGSIAPMPVELLYFNSKVIKGGVKLDWATASEKNSDHFEVQRSTDGVVFRTIGSVLAKGYSNTKVNYSYTDDRPAVGESYYRLKQVDLDNAYEFSKVVSVTQKGPVTFSVYPTITSGDIQFNIPNSATGTQLQIYDKMGRIVLAKVLPGKEVSHKVNLAHLNSGNYFVVLLDEKSQRKVFRVTKN